jgi:hypothetical protein
LLLQVPAWADFIPDTTAGYRPGAPIAMRIAFDVDGVLADLHRSFSEAGRNLFPNLEPASSVGEPSVAPAEDLEGTPGTPARPHLSRRQVDAVWRQVLAVPAFWETLQETEAGVVGRLAQIADAHGWEVIFLTSRPECSGPTVQRQTQRWLERHGFPLPSVYVVDAPRGRIADALALDVVVDDRPQTCLDIAIESKARPLLVWRGASGDVPHVARHPDIGVVPSVDACLELLVAADRQAGTVGAMHRLRRLLGLAAN